MPPFTVIPVGIVIGLVIPTLCIAFACVTFYASMDAVGRLRKRRQRKLRTAQDSLIEIGFAPNVVNSLIILDSGRSTLRSSSKNSALDINANPLDPDYVLELKRNQEKVTELKEKVASLKRRLNVLKGVEKEEMVKSGEASNNETAKPKKEPSPTVVPKAKSDMVPQPKSGAMVLSKKEQLPQKSRIEEVPKPKIDNVKSTKIEPLKESGRKNSVTTSATNTPAKQSELSSKSTDRKVSKDEQKTANTTTVKRKSK